MHPPTRPTEGSPAVRLARVFVVDDEPGVTRLLKINLEGTGSYKVRTENQPEKALEAAREFYPDLVLMDVMMPGLDGGDLAARFRADPRLRRVPIVFLTATVRHAEVDKHHGIFGGDRFLSKPVALPEVIECLEEILGPS